MKQQLATWKCFLSEVPEQRGTLGRLPELTQAIQYHLVGEGSEGLQIQK